MHSVVVKAAFNSVYDKCNLTKASTDMSYNYSFNSKQEEKNTEYLQRMQNDHKNTYSSNTKN